MPFGPFVLQWHTPTPNPPNPTPLPPSITRTYISTPTGPLELLSAHPSTSSTSSTSSTPPPLLFAHGGFGCASIWLSYMHFFASRGVPCYALSYRGHGGSWHPSFARMYLTPRSALGSDLVCGIREVERREGRKVVVVAHSAGAALVQWVLARGLVRVEGCCVCAGVPGFGSWSVYKFWAWEAPVQFLYRLFHPRYILATTEQVHGAFFTERTPRGVVEALEKLLAPYESMLWPVQGLMRFVEGGDVLRSIVGWEVEKGGSNVSLASESASEERPGGVTERLLILAAEKDVLCTPEILLDAASRYRAAFGKAVRKGEIEGVDEIDLERRDEKGGEYDGVAFKVVPGLGHHLMNHVEWEKGAEEIWEWFKKLN
ncbi:alpha/beta-hydrolase [Corynespora cassiicola Philippines]|uniref:Alpha/beta-hydrolase n=1 Tax=Corynespora cassiicola Philippines TaxID=1448308 RepID=A0A2T2N9F2_CORCC|nr:alpha/beta-hydrolase [Corynespora cassiicola Philippines]